MKKYEVIFVNMTL